MVDPRKPEDAPALDAEEVEEVGPPRSDSNDEEESLGSLDGMIDPMQQLTQLFVTEDNVPIVDVLQEILEALKKHNKVMYTLVRAYCRVHNVPLTSSG